MDNLVHKRNYSLDIARIIATLSVVMTHCCSYFLEKHPLFSNEFIIGNLFDSLSRIGVPLFIMISGSLFLDERKDITLKSVLFKNIKCIAIIIIIWSTIYSIAYNVILPISSNNTISIKNIIGGIINGPYHMWYLYMIIGLYIMTPFLRKFVCKENKEMVLAFITISLCFQFFTPVVNIICKLGIDLSLINEWMTKFELDFFGGYLAYYLVGWYIVNVGIKQKLHKNIIYLLGATSLVLIILYVHFTGDYKNAYKNIGMPVFVYSVSVFLALNNITWKLKEKITKKLATLSNLTFGVYMIHALLVTIYIKLFPYNGHCILYIIVYFMVVIFFASLISYTISKIPLLRKIIKT